MFWQVPHGLALIVAAKTRFGIRGNVVPDNSNELFQSAANSAVIFNAVLSLIGVVCIFMGYRLLVSRVERRGPGIIFALFGMAVIAIAIFNTMSGTRPEKTFGQGTIPPAIFQEPAPIVQRSTWPSRNTTKDEQASTKVRDAATPSSHFSSDDDAIPATSSEPSRLRGTGVQTKGGYVPFPRSSTSMTNRNRLLNGPLISNANERQVFIPLSNNARLQPDATNKPPIRSPFSVKMRVLTP